MSFDWSSLLPSAGGRLGLIQGAGGICKGDGDEVSRLRDLSATQPG